VPLALEVGADVDLVYCSLAPFATARAAATISRRLDKPLVLDLEDPWALDEMLVFETALHRQLERRAMRRALASADAIVMNTPESERRVLTAFPELAAKPITSIVNGYDAEDFVEPVTARTDGAFRIVHTGTLHSEANDERPLVRRLLGGAMDGVHVRSRSLIYLMQAVDQLIAQRPDLAGRMEIHLAGRLTPSDRAVVGDSQLIREHGFLSHRDTIALIRSADLLFLPMHDVPTGRSVAIVPCKTYEYIGSGRPILAAVPDGDAREFLTEAGTAELVRPTDVSGMKAALLRRLDRVDEGLPPVKAAPSLLRRLERRTLTSDLAAFLEPLVESRQSSVPSIAVDAAIG
jgi:glycosyltransferase involved in cell wall biosynthesis